MADNKRFVSYMYEYKEDEKQASVGYARIDARGSQCKVLIHISLPELEGRLLKAYMFYRKPGTSRFAYLGNLLIQDGAGELRVKSERDNILNSDLTLDDMCGIIVYQNNRKYAACEWDEEPITRELISQIENPDLVYNMSSMQETEKTLPKEEAVVVDYKGNPVSSLEDTMSAVPVPERPVQRQEKENEELAEALELTAARETESGSYQNRDYYKEQGSHQNYDYRNMRYSSQPENGKRDAESLRAQECPDVECIEPTYGECGEGIEQEAASIRRKNEEGRFTCHPIAQNIFRKFPRIYPFEDNEICDCVRIEPQDIGLLPIDAWVLGNNSYLLHGYYTYRHLIFGKINSPNGIIYVLGVPGIYQNRESFMAKMFGFEYFKCAKMTEEKNGEFGYYYLPIQL